MHISLFSHGLFPYSSQSNASSHGGAKQDRILVVFARQRPQAPLRIASSESVSECLLRITQEFSTSMFNQT